MVAKNVVKLVLAVVVSLATGVLIQYRYSDLEWKIVASPAPVNKVNDITDTEQFQISNYKQIRTIINESTLISWAPDFMDFVSEFGFDKLFSDEFVENRTKIWSNTTREVVIANNLCQAALDFNRTGKVKQHVLLSHFNENWGVLSTHIRNRTFDWGDVEMHWHYGRCSTKFIFDYLNHPNTLAVITVQFQAYDHPKVHSIPLGVKHQPKIVEQLKKPRQKRTNLLMMNHHTGKSTQYRADIADMVISNFNGSVTNTYDSKNEMGAFYDEMLQSKFIVSPGGVGWDCYRNWESLYMGTVPIIERFNRTDGWHRTFDDLPVLFVNNYNELTPGLLQTEYERIAARANDYNYEKLSNRYWVNFVNSFLWDKNCGAGARK